MPDLDELVAEVLNTHRWKTMSPKSVECECGEIIHGDDTLTGFPADEAFRHHIADAVLTVTHPAILLEAADAWTHGEWANVGHPPPGGIPALGYAQRFGDWLRNRAEKAQP